MGTRKIKKELGVFWLVLCLGFSTQMIITGECSINSENPAESLIEKNSARTISSSSKAIVLIPGVGGSELNNSLGITCWATPLMSLIECTVDGVSVNNIVPKTTGYGPMNLYESFYDFLDTEFGDIYDIIFFPYDWRMSCADAATELASVTSSYDELVLVAHSMGGLVASAFCTSATNRAKVDKIITLGTPFTGTPHLLYVAETGDFNELLTSTFIAPVIIKGLVPNFHCTYQLAPTTYYGDRYGGYIKYGPNNFDATYSYFAFTYLDWVRNNGYAKPMAGVANQFHYGLFLDNTHIADNVLVDTYKIVVGGMDTISRIVYDTNWNYCDFEINNGGDGTVPLYSASNNNDLYPSNRVYWINGTEHVGMIDNWTCRYYVASIINGTVTTQYSETCYSSIFNEKGWLLGSDNARIYITLNSSVNACFSLPNGNSIRILEDKLYDSKGKYIGFVGIVGGGKVKYCLHDNDYIVDLTNNEDFIDLKIEYQNNGFYEEVITYPDILSNVIEVSVSKITQKEVACYVLDSKGERTNVIEPEHIMDAEELEVRNR